MPRMVSIDQDNVGAGFGDFFKPSKEKQRIALVPSVISSTDLIISDALKGAASKGDREALEKVEELTDLKAAIQDGLKSKPPRVKQFKEGDIEKYLWPRADSALTHYIPSERMSILCKKAEYEAIGREPTCCVKSERDAGIMYAVVLMVYEADSKGQVIDLPPERQKPLVDSHGKVDPENKLDFKYNLQLWSLSDARMRAWKTFYTDFPLVFTDFYVQLDAKDGKTIKFSPTTGTATWLTKGPILMRKVLEEGAKMWERAFRAIGRDIPIEDIDTMFGVKHVSTPQNEKAFDDLLS